MFSLLEQVEFCCLLTFYWPVLLLPLLQDQEYLNLFKLYILLLLLVGSVRGTVYAALGFMTLYYIGKQRRLILPIIIILMFVLLVFLINPNSRLFETHTIGRIIHWLLIINSFELDRIFIWNGLQQLEQYINYAWVRIIYGLCP